MKEPLPAKAAKSRAPLIIIGCLVLLAIGGIVCAAGGIMLAAMAAPSDDVPAAVSDAISMANSDPRVQSTFGTPLRATKRESGGVSQFMDDEMLDCKVAVEGPKAGGTFHVAGQRKRGRLWTYDTLVLTPDVGPTIDLRAR